ncbi:hypothetical protein LCGC14_0922690 [marine sediment metagenome]|uniref:Uncharacterized protein n=1 Tax=marine sediment metagenome TaxID=412755 RepID=A0A0F9NV60_9ZZZZ
MITDRLLSDKEIKGLGLVTYDAKGDIDDADISGIAKVQDARTLKAVGEWLERIDYMVFGKDIDQLKQGKMPEEE